LIKLDIGSGGKSDDSEFIGVDAFTEADVNALMWDLPYKDGEVDVIFCNNALEHVSKFDVVPTLREWKRVLKIGGRLEIVVPDLEWACCWWLKNQRTDWSMDIIYGNQKHEGEFHKTGFTVDILNQYLEVCGGFQVQGVKFMGSSVLDIMTDNFPPIDEKGDGWIRVMQRCIDMEILRIGDDDKMMREAERPMQNWLDIPVKIAAADFKK
jgi:predicted SAM-dependent methyltransferase